MLDAKFGFQSHISLVRDPRSDCQTQISMFVFIFEEQAYIKASNLGNLKFCYLPVSVGQRSRSHLPDVSDLTPHQLVQSRHQLMQSLSGGETMSKLTHTTIRRSHVLFAYDITLLLSTVFS